MLLAAVPGLPRHPRMPLAAAQAGSLCYWPRCLDCHVIPACRWRRHRLEAYATGRGAWTATSSPHAVGGGTGWKPMLLAAVPGLPRHPCMPLAAAQAGSLCYWTRCLACPVIPARGWRGPTSSVISASRQLRLREAGGRVGRRGNTPLSNVGRSVRRPYRDPGRAGASTRARGLDPASATTVRTSMQGRSARSPTRPPGVPAAFGGRRPPPSPHVAAPFTPACRWRRHRLEAYATGRDAWTARSSPHAVGGGTGWKPMLLGAMPGLPRHPSGCWREARHERTAPLTAGGRSPAEAGEATSSPCADSAASPVRRGASAQEAG